MKQLRVMLLGCGTVGSGVYKTIKQNGELLKERLGLDVSVQSVLVLNADKKRPLPGIEPLLTTQFREDLLDETDVVVEVMGGVEPAHTYITAAMRKGCHVVTANKELLAKHGLALEKEAREHGVELLYEGSVGGGIPLIGVLQHFLKVNRVTRLSGILNGTTNYILTQMARDGRSFADVLAEAQACGYAEADPTSDVEGYDAMYKLAILARLAFGIDAPLRDITREGITAITLEEIRLAQKLGYTVKLLANAELRRGEAPTLGVQLTLVADGHPLAAVNDVYNALHVEGDVVQDVTLIGQGAGELPTASAVVEDIANVGRMAARARTPVFTLPKPMAEGERERPLTYVGLKGAGVIDGKKVTAVRSALTQVALGVQNVQVVQGEGFAWVGFVCTEWDEQRLAQLLSAKKLPLQVLAHTVRPCLGEAVQAEAHVLATAVN